MLLLDFAVLQNPGYLRLAVMCNEADIVEYALSLGLNAAETRNVSRILQAFLLLVAQDMVLGSIMAAY